jgi:ribosome-associated translation inhibitor RaiA
MDITTRVTGFDAAVQQRAYIEYRLFSAIRRFSRDCTRLAIRVEEGDSGPKRGRYRCSVVLDMMPGEQVRIRAMGSRLYGAIDRAADRLALAVERRVTKGR